MDSSIFVFATDIRDEGVDVVLDNVQHRAGLGGITVAAAYHEARDIFPHNPVRKVRFLENGAIFFRPDPARWREIRLQPPVSEAADALPELVAGAASRGLAVHAWTVFLHNGALAEGYADCAPQNAFGDPYLTELCPANPDVRAYARVLGAEVARLGVASIVAESLHYHPLELEEALGDFARAREEVVTSLGSDVAAAVRAEGAEFAFMDLSGAIKGYATGRPTGDAAPSIAWQLGVDVAAVAEVCGSLEAIGYARDPGRLRIDLEAYRKLAGEAPLSVVLRPAPPDCDSPQNLREKIRLAAELDLARVDFYHYGLMRLDALDLIREAATT